MSDIKIQPSATGSATITLTAPVSNTARTITFPDSTSTLLASDGSAANLTAIPAANITGTLPALSAANLTAIPAANITGTLPALSAANLTAIPAGNLTGTVADARISALTSSKLTGALPAISAASLTGLTIAQMPTGSVIQVRQGTRTGGFSTTSTSYVGNGLSTAITPRSTSSKILITIMCGFSVPSNDSAYFNIDRTIGGSGGNVHSHNEGFGAAQTATYRGIATLNYLDSPNTTSAITYALVVRTDNGNTIEIPAHSNALQTITLMEIQG